MNNKQKIKFAKKYGFMLDPFNNQMNSSWQNTFISEYIDVQINPVSFIVMPKTQMIRELGMLLKHDADMIYMLGPHLFSTILLEYDALELLDALAEAKNISVNHILSIIAEISSSWTLYASYEGLINTISYFFRVAYRIAMKKDEYYELFIVVVAMFKKCFFNTTIADKAINISKSLIWAEILESIPQPLNFICSIICHLLSEIYKNTSHDIFSVIMYTCESNFSKLDDRSTYTSIKYLSEKLLKVEQLILGRRNVDILNMLFPFTFSARDRCYIENLTTKVDPILLYPLRRTITFNSPCGADSFESSEKGFESIRAGEIRRFSPIIYRFISKYLNALTLDGHVSIKAQINKVDKEFRSVLDTSFVRDMGFDMDISMNNPTEE